VTANAGLLCYVHKKESDEWKLLTAFNNAVNKWLRKKNQIKVT